MKETEVLASTKAALKDAFGPKADEHTVKVTSSPPHGLTSLMDNPSPEDIAQQNIRMEETKKLVQNFREKVATYPKYISYEGSMILCVMLSMKSSVEVKMDNLPVVDQTIIRSLIKDNICHDYSYFYVDFDNDKDFILTFKQRPNGAIEKKSGYLEQTFNVFNTVAHPRQSDIEGNAGTVPIEDDDNVVKVGGKISINKRTIRTIIGHSSKASQSKHDFDDDSLLTRLVDKPSYDSIQSRQPVAGRNAFELRTDLIGMSMNLLIHNNRSNEISPEKVVATAKTLYSFVENKFR